MFRGEARAEAGGLSTDMVPRSIQLQYQTETS